jgi:hypothetical protein
VRNPDKSSLQEDGYSGNILLLTAICFTIPLPFNLGRKEQGWCFPKGWRDRGKEGEEQRSESQKERNEQTGRDRGSP